MALAALAPPSAACEPPKPALERAATTQERNPQIAWSPVPGATAYRVRLLSRVPNGRVVASHDTIVSEPRFVAPQPLAEHRAKVAVRLNAICGKETSADAASWFTIDTSPACRLEEFGAKSAGGKTTVSWPQLAGAGSYEVRAFALAGGRLIASQETRAASENVDLRGQAAVLSVRPACAGGPGEALYRVVPPG